VQRIARLIRALFLRGLQDALEAASPIELASILKLMSPVTTRC